jgi:hypothetical protein
MIGSSMLEKMTLRDHKIIYVGASVPSRFTMTFKVKSANIKMDCSREQY